MFLLCSCQKMSESAAISPEALVRNSERLPPMKKTAKLHYGENIIEQVDIQTVTEAPHHQVLQEPQPSCKEPKSSRRISIGSSLQSPRLSASHIEQAAGDVSDLTASLLLACLFCHFSDCVLLIPDTCCSGLRCLCSFSCLPDLYDLCCCLPSCCNNFDCEFLDLCHHTSECLELAMEVSELCYH
ncbi:myoD family inhibitor domain-containing protein 2 isoform X2 [Pyxicephalus adspersus]|uniref:myoD family inhibitor domain-containing protein 2 isoform X2 n=1 Tax=Pyxicephalus adspersus TaxID=30357 RepID=UPI003B5C5C12